MFTEGENFQGLLLYLCAVQHMEGVIDMLMHTHIFSHQSLCIQYHGKLLNLRPFERHSLYHFQLLGSLEGIFSADSSKMRVSVVLCIRASKSALAM
jgi:hypothetical protein